MKLQLTLVGLSIIVRIIIFPYLAPDLKLQFQFHLCILILSNVSVVTFYYETYL